MARLDLISSKLAALGGDPGWETDGSPRAAVAAILRELPGSDGADLFFIRRAEHPNDPWSGHVAFPGGRRDPEDPSLLATAIRETREEVGIDLVRDGRLIAPLDEIQAQARGRDLDMVITPFVFFLDEVRPPTPDTSEVADALWVPMRIFRDDRYKGSTHLSRDGFEADFPAFLYRGKTVWGLTYRILCGFLEVLDGVGVEPHAPGTR